MTRDEAEKFSRQVTPIRSKRDFKFVQNEQLRKIRMSDHQKGFETICRPLCESNGIRWQEKWNFLADGKSVSKTSITLSPGFTNLQSESGISILEQHLKDRRFEDAQQEPVDLNDTLDGLTSKVRHTNSELSYHFIVVLKSRYIKQSISG